MNTLKSVIDKSYDKNQIGKYELGLRIHQGNFIATVFSEKSKSFIGVYQNDFRSGTNNRFNINGMIEAFEKSTLKISKNYGLVKIAIANTHFSIIPKALFDAQNARKVLELNIGNSDPLTVNHQFLSEFDIVVVYGVESNLNDWLLSHFPKAKYTHDVAISIQSVLRDHQSKKEDSVILNIQNENFDLIFLKQGKLHFFNRFHFQEKEDLLYYLLFSAEQLQINTLETQVILLGNIEAGGNIHQIIQQYFQLVSIGRRNKNIALSPGLNHIPNHFYYSSFNLHSCE